MSHAPEGRQRANRIIFEGFVIVISVLLAFGIDAWWDRTQQAAAEAEWIAAVRLDLETSLGQLEESINTGEAAAGASSRLLELLRSPQSPRVDSIRDLASQAMRPIDFTPTVPGLDAGFSPGRRSVFESIEFRRALAAFRSSFTHFDDSRKRDWDHYFSGPLYDLRAPHGGLRGLFGTPSDGRFDMTDREYLGVMLTSEAYAAFETSFLAQQNQIGGLREMKDAVEAMVTILQASAR